MEGLAPMAAALTVPQLSSTLNSSTNPPRALIPARGIVTLFGYGISVRVDRGHLIVQDGIGAVRRYARFARVGHDLRRLIVVGSDGMVSFAALRWLADRKAAFVNLDRDGSVLVATGPVGPKDARLRRAQALAHHSGVAMTIARDLIDRKLAEQARIACDVFHDSSATATIAAARERLPQADTTERLRIVESQAALAYWGCWRALPVMFPKTDLPRVPDHWRTFGTRISPLTGSPRLSVNPPNAMLNYLYAVLESEARLAASALGLDPGLGVMHVDTNARDSLACDLMEPVRPAAVDAYVLNWLRQQPLRREWFFEERNGNCRLMGSFAERLSATAPTWAQAVAPIAERVAKVLWSTVRTSQRHAGPKTPLTQRHRREVKGASLPTVQRPQDPPRVCRMCGTTVRHGHTHCAECWARAGHERMRAVAAKGRLVAHTPEAQARRAAARRRNAAAQRAWKETDQPAWLTEQVYREQIQPRLTGVSAPRLAAALGVSTPYAVDIRAGRRCPHLRHWGALARLVGAMASGGGQGVPKTYAETDHDLTSARPSKGRR